MEEERISKTAWQARGTDIPDRACATEVWPCDVVVRHLYFATSQRLKKDCFTIQLHPTHDAWRPYFSFLSAIWLSLRPPSCQLQKSPPPFKQRTNDHESYSTRCLGYAVPLCTRPALSLSTTVSSIGADAFTGISRRNNKAALLEP
jgi:hypothetical protein